MFNCMICMNLPNRILTFHVLLIFFHRSSMSTSIRQIFEDFMGETMGENSDLDFANGDGSFSFAETAAQLAESLVSSIFVDASVG